MNFAFARNFPTSRKSSMPGLYINLSKKAAQIIMTSRSFRDFDNRCASSARFNRRGRI